MVPKAWPIVTRPRKMPLMGSATPVFGLMIGRAPGRPAWPSGPPKTLGFPSPTTGCQLRPLFWEVHTPAVALAPTRPMLPMPIVRRLLSCELSERSVTEASVVPAGKPRAARFMLLVVRTFTQVCPPSVVL